MFERTRIYYRNAFMHIGHLNTLYHNDKVAKIHNGICYAVVDDREDPDRCDSMKEDFDYLGLTNTTIVSVFSNHERIRKFTEMLICRRLVYIHHCNTIECNPDKIMQYLTDPKIHFQIKLRCGPQPDIYDDPSIGYTRDIRSGKPLDVVLIFDYIIKVLDVLLDITDIITSTSTSGTSASIPMQDIGIDVKDRHIMNFFDTHTDAKINYHRIETYFIYGFRYTKKNWPLMDNRNPYLLTIKGLKARHVPRIVLYAFYLHGTQMGSIKITYLGNLLESYFNRTADRVLAVTKPLKIQLTNWSTRRTEYVIRPNNQTNDLSLSPLSDVLYIDQTDCGIDYSKITKGRICRLKYGPSIRCSEIIMDMKGPCLMQAEVIPSNGKEWPIYWISSEWGQPPICALFYQYNWFYTGQNVLNEPIVTSGYIEQSVFRDLSRVYHIERHGFYIYDQQLSATNSVPSFICIYASNQLGHVNQ